MKSKEDVRKILNKINVKIQLAPKDITAWDIIKLYYDYPYRECRSFAESIRNKIPKSVFTSPQLIKEIADFMVSPDIHIRELAEQILKEIDNEQTKGLLSPKAMNLRWIASQELDPFLLAEAARYLGEIGEREGVEPLIKALSHPHKVVRGNAAIALGKIGDQRALPHLIRVLRDQDSFVREKTAAALLNFPENDIVLPLVETYRNDCIDNNVSQMRLKKYCTQGIYKIGLPAATVLSDIIFQQEEIPCYRLWALTLLMIMGLVPLRIFLDITGEKEIANNLALVNQIFRDLGIDISLYKEYFLPVIMETDNLEFLKRIVYARDPDIKRLSLERLYQLDKNVFDDIFGEVLICNWPSEKEMLMKFGERTIAPIRSLLVRCGPQVRMNCLQLLGEMGNRKGLHIIREHLQDGNSEVRKAALQMVLKMKVNARENIPDTCINELIELVDAEYGQRALDEIKKIGQPVLYVIKDQWRHQNMDLLAKIIIVLEAIATDLAIRLLVKIWRYHKKSEIGHLADQALNRLGHPGILSRLFKR